MPIWSGIQACYEGAFRVAVIMLREKVAPLVGKEIPLAVRGKSANENLRGRAVLNTLRLDTTKIGDEFDCTVTLSDPMPSDEAGNLRMAMEAIKAGLLSPETALEKYKIVSDAWAELERVELYKIFSQLAGKELIKVAIERGYAPKPSVPEVQPVEQQPPLQAPPGMDAAALQAMAPGSMPVPDMAQMAGEPPPVPMPQMPVG